MRTAVASVLALAAALHAMPAPNLSASQTQTLPPALLAMIETERVFAARALVVGWKQAFLEYFANNQIRGTGVPASRLPALAFARFGGQDARRKPRFAHTLPLPPRVVPDLTAGHRGMRLPG